MVLTRKHFIGIADAVVDAVEISELKDAKIDNRALNYLVHFLGDFCSVQNPRFDRERFTSYIFDKLNWDGTAEDSTSNEPEVI